MNAVIAFFVVLALVVVAWLGVGTADLRFLFGVILPYAGLGLFVVGIVYRILHWAASPVPFRIPTSCGQQKSLPWIKSAKLDNPHSFLGTVGRMALEVLCFRSLMRNTSSELREGPKIGYGPNLWLWVAGLAFHWSFLVILIRHFRYFTEPVPAVIAIVGELDGFFQVGLPILYLTDIFVVGALTYLFLRRVFIPQMRTISLVADYLALFLLLGITTTGVLLRYFTKTDIVAVKELAMGLMSFNPVIPDGIGVMFFIHLFLVSCLLAYFPISKLMHMGGVFLSPTRNLANNNRVRRHINPWNPKVKLHTYEEYEDEFRDVMKEAGLPLEKE
ncbi:MAG: sulfate reduction electron transfer complex DsrMKJOP subunit DsrM [candidate division Zixibacteria bacterium]|nr:sulfate reduction electron transfer complex DsrMKJOP subunit DsrM [candidate division Zixibacteria bacterium]